jgi:toxin ParE1/3/4
VKVRFSDEALRDLRGIGDYIAKDNPLRARDFVRELRHRAIQLADNPLAYRSFRATNKVASAAACFATT